MSGEEKGNLNKKIYKSFLSLNAEAAREQIMRHNILIEKIEKSNQMIASIKSFISDNIPVCDNIKIKSNFKSFNNDIQKKNNDYSISNITIEEKISNLEFEFQNDIKKLTKCLDSQRKFNFVLNNKVIAKENIIKKLKCEYNNMNFIREPMRDIYPYNLKKEEEMIKKELITFQVRMMQKSRQYNREVSRRKDLIEEIEHLREMIKMEEMRQKHSFFRNIRVLFKKSLSEVNLMKNIKKEKFDKGKGKEKNKDLSFSEFDMNSSRNSIVDNKETTENNLSFPEEDIIKTKGLISEMYVEKCERRNTSQQIIHNEGIPKLDLKHINFLKERFNKDNYNNNNNIIISESNLFDDKGCKKTKKNMKEKEREEEIEKVKKQNENFDIKLNELKKKIGVIKGNIKKNKKIISKFKKFYTKATSLYSPSLFTSIINCNENP